MGFNIVNMIKFRPIEYVQEIKNEVRKVVWPTKRETTVTSIMVLIFVFVAAIFFLIADQILSWFVGLILGIGG
jgi:preprotein translocase subunit SecE